ncbi:MAG: Asp-tRNA(Asn)/Glu-tRNA(Gln) amidotransferase subunit GatB [Planctomycetia bacterium]
MSLPYRIVVGLEVHVQLTTETKLFCDCPTTFGRPANTQTCEVCIGMPGVLPVLNRRAFELGLKSAVALGCSIAKFTKWDRKHYFYPDLPKAYQISQYDMPFAVGGTVELNVDGNNKTVRLIRIHLEEDAGKNLHSDTKGDSLVDLNRTGTPLLEIVSEPDMTSSAEAMTYVEKIRTLMRDLEASDCEMQEGSLRCDANVNIHFEHDGRTVKTPVVEIKNINSVRSIGRAIDYEAGRQFEQWRMDKMEIGQRPKQTRGWNDPLGETRPQREKEEAADYRYFPEPDLVPVVVDDAWIERIRAEISETSAQRAERYKTTYGLNDYQADQLVFKGGRATSDYFEELLRLGVDAKAAANWTINDVLAHATGRIKTMGDLPIAPAALAALLGLVKDGKLNLNDAREKVLPEIISSGRPAEEVAKEMGLEVVADAGAVDAVVDAVMAGMAQAVADFRGGKQAAFGALMGAVMKKAGGKFPPALVKDALTKKLS